MRRPLALVLAASFALGSSAGERADPRTPRLRLQLARAPRDTVAAWVFFAGSVRHATREASISSELLRSLREAGAHVRYVSRWLDAVSIDGDSATIERVSRLKRVLRIQPVARLARASVDPRATAVVRAPRPASAPHAAALEHAVHAQGPDSAFYGPNWPAIRELGIPNGHRLGFTGNGVRIAIIDTGFEPRHESLAGRRVIAARDFIHGDAVVYNEPAETFTTDPERHGTQVWSLLGGYRPGLLVGPAYDAEFLLAKVDVQPGDTRADEDRWVAAVEWADSMGARIISSSLYYRFDFTDRPDIPYAALDGDQTVTTRIADEAARHGILLFNAMGNAGPSEGTLSAPADADSIVAVGAVNASGAPATFPNGATARGPTFDGRTKPELSARGTGLFAASSISTATYDIGLAGTSYATPLVAGAAAMLIQAWPDLNAMAVRRALLLSATRTARPDNAVGAGLPDIASAILFPDGLRASAVSTITLNGEITTLAPTFSWSATQILSSVRPIRYRLELATDSLFGNIFYADTVTEAFSLRVRSALRPTPALWWRVVASTPLGIQRISPPAGPFVMPSWVRLISPDPARVTFVQTPRPDLSWVPLTAPPPVGPLVYDVEVLSLETGEPVQPAIRNITGSSVRVPRPLVPNESYRWRVIAHSAQGAADTILSVSPFVVVSPDAPPATLLYQNFPNPFPGTDPGSNRTNIWFDLAERSPVELDVLDLRGRLVRHLIPATPDCGTITLPPGVYGRGSEVAGGLACAHTTWDGTDYRSERVPRGVYVLRMRAAGQVFHRRMVYLPR